MRRRESFCASGLPYTHQTFNQFFGIEWESLTLDPRERSCSVPTAWKPSTGRVTSVQRIDARARTPFHPTRRSVSDSEAESESVVMSGSGSVSTNVGMSQVDGTGAGKGKGKNKKTTKDKNKNKRVGNEGKVDGRPRDAQQNEAQVEAQIESGDVDTAAQQDEQEKPEERGERGSSVEKQRGDEQCTKVHEVIVVYGDRGVSPHGQNTEAGVEDEHSEEDDHNKSGNPNAPIQNKRDTEAISNSHVPFCHFHGRFLCQFSAACCVHRPAAPNCGCPPQRSCCCMHHAGDCCNCRLDYPYPPNGDAADTESKTLSFAGDTPPPTSPPIDAVPQTTSILASSITPDQPSGVALKVTPASPTPYRAAEPVVMGGAEDEQTLAVQAGIDLSKNLIQMMECHHMTDLTLVLDSKNEQWHPISLAVHRCVVARSPLITALLSYSKYQKEIRACACENFFHPKPWEQAIHYLYGKPLMSANTIKSITLDGLGYVPNPEPGCEIDYPFPLPSVMLDMALGYAVCGTFFYLPEIESKGFRLALDLLSWETVEQMLTFGLEAEKFAVVLPDSPFNDPSYLHDEAHSRRAHIEGPSGGRAIDVKESGCDNNNDTNTAELTNDNDSVKPSVKALITASDPTAARMPSYPIPLLKGDWSRRLIAAVLNFLVDHITPEFRLHDGAHSDKIPNRIPENLVFHTPDPARESSPEPKPVSPTFNAREGPVISNRAKGDTASAGVELTPAKEESVKTPAKPIKHCSDALAKNPALATYLFGSIPAPAPSPDKITSPSAPATATTNEPGRNDGSSSPLSPKVECQEEKEKEGLLDPSFITSAILLSLPFIELGLAFETMVSRGAMTASLAQDIILEREKRRMSALKMYAEGVIASLPPDRFENGGQDQTTANEGDTNTKTATGASGSGSTPGAKASKKSKPKKSGKKNKKAKAKAKSKNNNQAQTQQETEKEQENAEDDVTVRSVHVPDKVRELCYREFYSKVVRGYRDDGSELEEIVLEREWVGFEH
ncbi:hypothetical protein BJY04DRAFT_218968 [Aspergillus karnatakaensis]|uniref:uncharacterized protein n=1 Tax=Aspergillus karnatakaensis TaxID=1810916 RepID=UPI003CCDA85B